MRASSESKRLLIIDDEDNMRHMLSALLRKSGYRIDTAADGEEGLQKVNDLTYDYILCDIKMPNKDGMTSLREARSLVEPSTVIMMSAYGTIDTAVEAMKLGAYDFISKPFKPDEVYLSLKKAEERERLKKENLRDNMSNLELVLNMLAEATTTEISKEKDPQGFDDSKRIARQGGQIAGNTRKEIEERTGKPVVTSKNARDLLDEARNEALESGDENEE